MSTWPCCLSYSKRVTYSNFQRSDALKRGKTDDPTYYLYHMMLGHPTKNCYIFKDVLQALVDAEVVKLRPEQKKVTTNMTATSPIQFGRNLPLAPTEVILIPKRN